MLLRIENTPRPYAWGSTTAIAELLGTAPSGGPEAELWLGDHPGSPARIVGGTEAGADHGRVEPDLAAYLTARGQKLPFLLKVLAAAEPLSLQAHPTIAQAREGFARENAAGIALDDPARNYKDELHKPELIFALSDPFIALAGFRSIETARAELAAADEPALAPLIEKLTGDDALPEVVRWLIGRGEGVADVVDAVAGLARRLEQSPHDSASWATVRRLAHHYPGDPGVALSLLMHTVVLRPGEALYLPTGNIHSYQSGLAIEVMAASDNVLRGGLTPKHVDTAEFMRVLDARPLPVPRIDAVELAPGVRRFTPDVIDFSLIVVDGGASTGAVSVPVEGPSIALCLAGTATVGRHCAIKRGDAIYSDDSEWIIDGDARVVIATGRRNTG